MSYTIAAFYHFASIDDPSALRVELETVCLEVNVKGSLLWRTRGINGTISSSEYAVESVLNRLRMQQDFAN